VPEVLEVGRENTSISPAPLWEVIVPLLVLRRLDQFRKSAFSPFGFCVNSCSNPDGELSGFAELLMTS